MQSDIEIYLLSCPQERILDWLQQTFTHLETPRTHNAQTLLVVQHQQQAINVTITEQAAGKKFTSVWFDSPNTPWANDIDCARQAYAAMACEVRCINSSWQEDESTDPDQWWKINQYEEGPFIWR